jgi:hypothetical protein
VFRKRRQCSGNKNNIFDIKGVFRKTSRYPRTFPTHLPTFYIQKHLVPEKKPVYKSTKHVRKKEVMEGMKMKYTKDEKEYGEYKEGVGRHCEGFADRYISIGEKMQKEGNALKTSGIEGPDMFNYAAILAQQFHLDLIGALKCLYKEVTTDSAQFVDDKLRRAEDLENKISNLGLQKYL